jgi:hypothetical protein
LENFYIGSASVELFRVIFTMSFTEIVDIALPSAEAVIQNTSSMSKTRHGV